MEDLLLKHRNFTDSNLETPYLQCEVCKKEFGRTERIDCINDYGREESFCIPDWVTIVSGS